MMVVHFQAHISDVFEQALALTLPFILRFLLLEVHALLKIATASDRLPNRLLKIVEADLVLPATTRRLRNSRSR